METREKPRCVQVGTWRISHAAAMSESDHTAVCRQCEANPTEVLSAQAAMSARIDPAACPCRILQNRTVLADSTMMVLNALDTRAAPPKGICPGLCFYILVLGCLSEDLAPLQGFYDWKGCKKTFQNPRSFPVRLQVFRKIRNLGAENV